MKAKRTIPALIVLAALAGFCWLFPPFHVRSLQEVRKSEAGAQFDGADFVEGFWSARLLPATARASDASAVLAVADSNPGSVRSRFGRTVGVSSSYFLFVAGSGRVVSAGDDNIGLSLEPDGEEMQIVIPLGFVFGNAVRDGTGLLDPSSHPNAQEFNDISAALNAKVETSVMPRLQEMATIGSRIRFAGCAEVADEELDLKPLVLVPVLVEPE